MESLRIKRLIRTAFSLLVTGSLVTGANAATVENIAEDLSPIEAKVAMVTPKGVALNRGFISGVKIGDLFTVYHAVSEIRDPDSGKSIGTMEEPVALLQVESVQEMAAVGKPVIQITDVQKGMKAVRFKSIPTLLLDREKTAESFQFRNRLKLALKQLDWEADRPGDDGLIQSWDERILQERGINLVFVLSPEELLAMNRKGEPIRRWELDNRSRLPGPVAATPEARSQPSATVGQYRKLFSLEKLVIGLEVLDIDQDNQPDLLYLTPDTLVLRPGAPKTEETRYRHEGFGQILNFSVSSYGLVALNIYDKNRRMISQLLQLENGKFRVLAKNINYTLGFFDLSGSGRREVLLGQRYHHERIMGGDLVRFEFEEGRFASGSALDVPNDFQIAGAAFFGKASDPNPGLIYINPHHKLVIRETGSQAWMSPKRVGGAVSAVSVNVGTDKFGMERHVGIETPPVPVAAERKDGMQFLVIANKSSHFRLFGGLPSFESGMIYLVRDTDLGKSMEPVIQPLEGAIQGLSIHNGEIYCALVKGNRLTHEFESHIIALPLQRRQG